MYTLLNKVVVDKKVKPLPYSKRRSVELIIGYRYFVSFTKNIAYPCKLVSIDEFSVRVEIPIRTKKTVRDTAGNIIDFPVERHSLRKDCIGSTPEEAVLHQV